MSISKMMRCTRTWEAEQLSCRNHIWLDFDWPSNGHFSLSFLYLTYSFLLFVYPWFGRGFKSDQTQALAFEKIWLNSGSLFLLSASLLSIKVVFFTTHSRVSWWMVPISFWFWVKTQPSFSKMFVSWEGSGHVLVGLLPLWDSLKCLCIQTYSYYVTYKHIQEGWEVLRLIVSHPILDIQSAQVLFVIKLHFSSYFILVPLAAGRANAA